MAYEKIRYLHFFGLSTALVAELYQRYHHGQTQTSNQDVEDSCYVTERQSAGLFLVQTHTKGKKRTATQRRVLKGVFMLTALIVMTDTLPLNYFIFSLFGSMKQN